jgi:hypothetical protein
MAYPLSVSKTRNEGTEVTEGNLGFPPFPGGEARAGGKRRLT